MITREQVADLQPGDVVELTSTTWPDGTIVRGALYETNCWLYVAGEVVRAHDGSPGLHSHTLTVVSRAPRPLYVNHPRTTAAAGDVVRIEGDGVVVMRTTEYGWIDGDGSEWDPKRKDRLRLLVDGETGQVVQ